MQSRNSKLILCPFCFFDKIDSPFCLQNCFFLLAAHFAQILLSKFCQGIVLIIDLHARFHSDSALYPDSGFQFDTVVYPKVVLTVVFIPTVVYILTVVSSLSDYSPQHSPHSYFQVIFISAYPAVRLKLYAYVNMLGRND